jgi:pentatricopeptide repeat protein
VQRLDLFVMQGYASLSLARRASKFVVYLESRVDVSLRPCIKIYGSYITVLTQTAAGLTSAAEFVKTMENGINRRPAPSVWLYNSLMAGYLREGQHDLIDAMWSNIRTRTDCNTITYSHVITSLLHRDMVEAAYDTLIELDESKVEYFPTDVLKFNTIIRSLAKKGFIRKAEHLFDLLRSRDSTRSRPKPNALTYSFIIDMYCKHGRGLEALKMAESLDPDIRTHICISNSMMNVYAINGHPTRAIELFQSLEAPGGEVNEQKYRYYVEAMSHHEETFPLALELLHSMEERKLSHRPAPSLYIYNGIINGYIRHGYFEAALRMFRSLPHFPNAYTNSIIMEAYSHLALIPSSSISDVDEKENPEAIAFFHKHKDQSNHQAFFQSSLKTFSAMGRFDLFEECVDVIVKKSITYSIDSIIATLELFGHSLRRAENDETQFSSKEAQTRRLIEKLRSSPGGMASKSLQEKQSVDLIVGRFVSMLRQERKLPRMNARDVIEVFDTNSAESMLDTHRPNQKLIAYTAMAELIDQDFSLFLKILSSTNVIILPNEFMRDFYVGGRREISFGSSVTPTLPGENKFESHNYRNDRAIRAVVRRLSESAPPSAQVRFVSRDRESVSLLQADKRRSLKR